MIARHLPENFVHGWLGFVPRRVEGKQSPASGRGMLYEESLPRPFTLDDAPCDAPAVNSCLSDRRGRSSRFYRFGGVPKSNVGPTFETNLITRPNFVAIDAPTRCRRGVGDLESNERLDLLIEEWPTAGLAVYDALAMQFGNWALAAAVRA